MIPTTKKACLHEEEPQRLGCGWVLNGGAGFGIATGGTGIAATVPGEIAGGFVGWFTADQFRRCPSCGRVFKT